MQPYRRAGSGPWDIMDRGSFNGPGGPHRRWVVPASEGASMPAGFMLRNRLRLEFVRPEQVLRLNRGCLANSGVAVARVIARAVDPAGGGVAGITVALDGEGDRTPACDMKADPLCPGQPVWNFYSVEVVQRIGYDSFTPDNSVHHQRRIGRWRRLPTEVNNRRVWGRREVDVAENYSPRGELPTARRAATIVDP